MVPGSLHRVMTWLKSLTAPPEPPEPERPVELPSTTRPAVDREFFFDRYRESFGRLTQEQVNGYNEILDHWDWKGYEPTTQLAYILATAWHESAQTIAPVRETLAETDEQAVRRLTRWLRSRRKKNYAARDPETGQSYYGRGLVQLTHKSNYLKAGQELGYGDQFVKRPELVMQLPIAVAILIEGMRHGWFTGKRLDQYVNRDHKDYVNARRVVNGLDKAHRIARNARKFERCLRIQHDAT